MNRQMENSSGSDSDNADIEKLHAIWKNIHQQKKNNQKVPESKATNHPTLGSVKNAIHQEEQKNLEARLGMTQKQLIKSRQNTALLMKKLGQAEQEIEYLEFELNKQKKKNQQKTHQIEQLKLVIEQKYSKQQTFGFEREKENINENVQLKCQIQSLNNKIEGYEKQINRLYLKIKSMQLDKKKNEDQIKNLGQLNESYKKQIGEVESAINDIYIGEQVKGGNMVELDQANQIIERLVLLLRNTDEFKEFGDFAEEVKNIHFLKNIPKRLKSNNLNHRPPERKRMCTCMDVKIDERLLWTPAACYKMLLEMKIKYDSLTEDCIEEVLFQLNKVWLGREQAHVRRVKETYQTEIIKLKKKTEQRYDEIVARKQIQRLKKQLQTAKSTRKNSSGVSLENLKNIGQYEDELRVKERQVKLLHERIQLLEAESNACDKSVYLEGALWLIDKVLLELEANQEDLRLYEVHFREKMEENETAEDWMRSYKSFFESITEIHNGLVQKLFSMKQSTRKKITGEKGLKKMTLKVM